MTPPSLTQQLGTIVLRDLRALRREVELYPDDASVWALPAGISNSAGTLVLHLVGNLRCYIGSTLGADGYERDRPREFSARGLSRAELTADLDKTLQAVERALPQVTAEVLAAEYPLTIGNVRVNTQDFLLHLIGHLGYHLGQVDYHRRIVTGSTETAATVAPGELLSARPAPTP